MLMERLTGKRESGADSHSLEAPMTTTRDPSDSKPSRPLPSGASTSPRPEKPDPLAPPRKSSVKVDDDPLHEDSVRPIP
jgi:hypothetical protein